MYKWKKIIKRKEGGQSAGAGMKIKQSKFFEIAATMTSSVFANPAASAAIMDSGCRREIMMDIVGDLQVVLSQNGFEIIEDE